MRADARRNRERIVTAALRVFAERGAAASMEEIARAAGLGVGTLYRHFPDRRALLEEIASDALDRMLGFGGEQPADPQGEMPHWQAFLRLVEHCTGEPFSLLKTFGEETGVAPAAKVRAADAKIAEAAERAQKEGTLRTDLTPEEVVAVLSAAICRPGARFDDPVVRVMLDGLRV
jgi:AcrR family transcriptional regulator